MPQEPNRNALPVTVEELEQLREDWTRAYDKDPTDPHTSYLGHRVAEAEGQMYLREQRQNAQTPEAVTASQNARLVQSSHMARAMLRFSR